MVLEYEITRIRPIKQLVRARGVIHVAGCQSVILQKKRVLAHTLLIQRIRVTRIPKYPALKVLGL